MLSKNSLTVLEKRYLIPGERPEDLFLRVANNVSEADALYFGDRTKSAEEFYNLMSSLDFLPNSPTLMNAGRELQQLSACFVLPVDDSIEGIFDAVKNMALVQKSGGGTGFSFSRLRPKNDEVKSTKGVSSGPVSFMAVFNAATEAIKQGGTRRGASIGILRVDHPDILEFIRCKNDHKSFNNFNISVAVTDAFMEAYGSGKVYDLINPKTGMPTGSLKARDVFAEIVENSWEHGDPGLIFIDRLNQYNPTPLIGAYEACNPCGEQMLLPFESCNLGSINLSNLFEKGEINWLKLDKIVEIAVHFLDNVIDMNKYTLPQIEHMTKSNRKIGLGVMGFADLLIKLRIAYGSDKSFKLAHEIMGRIQEDAKTASITLGKARGSFPNFAMSLYAEVGAMRNATVTTIAPTGTLSIIAGCSSGIEPVFALAFVRHILDGQKLLEINPLFEKAAKSGGYYDLLDEVATKGLQNVIGIPEFDKSIFITAHDVLPEAHVKMQAAFQAHVDNAVSKTVNFPHDATVDEVRRVYEMAYKLGCKGITIYRDRSRSSQVLNKGLK